jgi:nitroreductase
VVNAKKELVNVHYSEEILGTVTNVELVKLMSLFDLILSRRSIRSYESKEIPQEILSQILEAGRQAPSAVNRQPIRFVVVTDAEAKNEISSGLFGKHVKNAPVVIVGCADEKSLLTGKWAVVDATIALQNMVIAAWSFGVGSCWIGSFSEEKVKKFLKIPDKWKVVALLTLGYPAEQPKAKNRKPFEELFSFNKF